MAFDLDSKYILVFSVWAVESKIKCLKNMFYLC